MGAGNPLGCDYRDPRHVERYKKLVIRHPTGETEGKHPRDADVEVMREIHDPAPMLRVIRAKCLDCSGGVESEVRKCTAIGCALWPYRMAWNPFRTPISEERRQAARERLVGAREMRVKMVSPALEPGEISNENEPDAPGATPGPTESGRAVEAAE
jgi:hypothetical protein